MLTQPGADGELPPGFDEWRRGLTYTVEPRLLIPLSTGDEYLINATVRRVFDRDYALESYEPLYRRASALAHARVAELSRTNDRPLQSWIRAHGWFRNEIPTGTLASATITLVVRCAGADETPPGATAPDAEALASPFVTDLHALATRAPAHGLDEIYIDFDRDEAAEGNRIVTVSYGEYVSTCREIDYAPFLQRAESRARFHYDSFGDRAGRPPFAIIRREWECLDTGKQSNPAMAHVNVYYRV